MTENEEYALMVDLAKLLKKHGPERFELLATMISSPEFIEKFSGILRTSARVYRAKASPTRTSLAAEVLRLRDLDSRKYELLVSFENKLRTGRILPTLKQMRGFAVTNGLPEIQARSRSSGIQPLIRSMLPLSTEQLAAVVSHAVESSVSRGGLNDWSELITKKMSRSRVQLPP